MELARAFPSASRWTAFVALSMLAGCGGSVVADERETRVSFVESGGDVWGFSARVRGRIEGECPVLRVGVAGREETLREVRGLFEAVVPLSPGRNDVRARCIGGGIVRAVSAPLRFHVRATEGPRAEARVQVSRETIILDGTGSSASERSNASLQRFHWTLRAAGIPRKEPLARFEGARVTARMPAHDGTYRVELEIVDEDGRRDRAATLLVVNGGVARASTIDDPPPWVDDAIVYGVSPALLGDAPFDRVASRLDHLQRIGVTALWIAPIHPASPDDEYGYAVEDHFGVRASYGTEDDLRRLIRAAHARGIRILLDMVPNHTADTHPYFDHARREGERSRYHAFFDRGPDGRPRHYFDWKHLPNLDYGHPEVRRMATEVFLHWVRELGVDGFRVDVAWGIARRDPSFFRALREELRRIEPEILLIAEASARDPRVVDAFDAAYDWTDHPGRWAWQDAFPADGALDLLALDEALFGESASRPLTVRFLNNNDTGTRFVTRHGVERTKVATALLFTLPGIPALFMGDEVGAEFHPYEQLEPLRFPLAPALVEAHRRLVALRQERPVLRTGELVQVPIEPHDRVFAFLRAAPGERSLVVLLNFDESAVDARFELPDGHEEALGARARDVLNGRPRELRATDRGYVVRLEPHSAVVLERHP